MRKLTQDVSDELHWEPAVQDALVRVQAHGGLVRLQGELPSAAQCWSAERAARRVAGVQALDMRLTVRPAAGGAPQDGDIAHAVCNVLAWLVGPPVQKVQVAVRDGCVTLTGHLPWSWQKSAILAALRLLPGVRSLRDGMQVDPGQASDLPSVPDGQPIAAAIRRRIASQSLRVRVQVQGSGVTLSGRVGSPAERALATHAAWGTPGVREVHDLLQLVG